MSGETTTHECPRCGDVHLPRRPDPEGGYFEHEPDCVLGKMESYPEDDRKCWRCGGRWVR